MHHITLAKLETGQDALYPPFGILYVANALERAGYKVTVFHEIGNICSLAHEQIESPKVFQLKNILKAVLMYTEKIRWKKRFLNLPIELQLLSFLKSIKGYAP